MRFQTFSKGLSKINTVLFILNLPPLTFFDPWKVGGGGEFHSRTPLPPDTFFQLLFFRFGRVFKDSNGLIRFSPSPIEGVAHGNLLLIKSSSLNQETTKSRESPKY